MMILAGSREALGQALRRGEHTVTHLLDPDSAWIGMALYALAAVILIQTIRYAVRDWRERHGPGTAPK